MNFFTFVGLKNIDPNSELGTSLYRVLLKSSRIPGDDWEAKLDTSVRQTEEDSQSGSFLRTTDNIFKKNLSGTSPNADNYFDSLRNFLSEKENVNSEQLTTERQMAKFFAGNTPRTSSHHQWSSWSRSGGDRTLENLPEIAEHNNESSSQAIVTESGNINNERNAGQKNSAFEESNLRSTRWLNKGLTLSSEKGSGGPLTGKSELNLSRASTPSKSLKGNK